MALVFSSFPLSMPSPDPDDFPGLLAAMQRHADLTVDGHARVFTTTPPDGGWYAVFLAALPADRRQHYDCRACRQFVDRYGGLVVIDADGTPEPAVWPVHFVDSILGPVVCVLRHAVLRAPVDGVFLQDSGPPEGMIVLGLPRTPPCPGNAEGWTHFALRLPRALIVDVRLSMTADQRAAEVREEHGMLRRGLAEFSADVVRVAVALLESEVLYRAEKVLGPAKWLADLHAKIAGVRDSRRRDNLLWLAAATAPPGWCHVRSTMIGTLLADLAAGVAVEVARRKFAEKMHPLQYQRPTAPPSDQTIAQAEKLIAQMGVESALQRRFAQLSDVMHRALWTPPPPSKARPTAGVFGHLRQQARAPLATELPTRTLTWEKFRREVLPTAERIEYQVTSGPLPCGALVTAVDPLAKPILQWDSEMSRNPVSWYVYHVDPGASGWHLTAHTWAAVTAVMLAPPAWGDPPQTHHGEAAWFLLDGCRDTTHRAGGGMFPESLRSEYHAVRKVIEAHALQSPIAGRDEASACGLRLQRGALWHKSTLRVTSRGTVSVIKLDRWD